MLLALLNAYRGAWALTGAGVVPGTYEATRPTYTAPVRLKCKPCDVLWLGDDGPDCWVCGTQGTGAYQ